MSKKSLKASTQGIKKAEEALTVSRFKQKDLIARIGCSRQPVSKFFNGQSIASDLFVGICKILKLDWEEIREKEEDIDALVCEVRQKVQTDIVERCGTMRVLDMRQPIGLNDIYTDVYILEKITANQRLEFDQLNHDYNPDSEDFDRYWLSKREKRVPGIDIVAKSSKIVILGKPGSGKTTFLKFLCLQCILGNLQSQRLPIFISLKEFTEAKEKPDLFTFIEQKFSQLSVTKDELITILTYSRGLIVLDGLDEVSEENSERVKNEIENFSSTYSLSALFNEDIKYFSEKRAEIQLLIKGYRDKIDDIKKILKVFEDTQEQEQVIKEDIDMLENSEILDEKQLDKIIIKNLDTIILILKYNKNIKSGNDILSKQISNQTLINILEDFSQKIECIRQKIECIRQKMKEEKSKTSEKNKQENQLFQEILQQLKNFLDTLIFGKEQLVRNPEYYLLKQKYEQQKQLCDGLNKKIQEKKNELENTYPDLSQYPDRGLDLLSKRFPNKIYKTNFIITCRTASLDFNFTQFTEVEIADFNDQQIEVFVHKWFHDKDPIKEKNFLQQLSLNEAIKELANSPLLLTLLCLVFGEVGYFSKNRSELYQDGVNILVQKWDTQRNIYREQIYKNLTNSRKQDLLSQVALIAFERKDYFIKQKEVEKHILTYIQNLPEAETDLEVLTLDSEAVLKSIEAQHGLLIERARGIYSFSHLTFQEYFTARKITNTSDPKILEQSLRELASHITQKRWREVFLLAIGLLSEADFLIQNMKEQVDFIMAEDRDLQSLLIWANQRASYCQFSEQLSSIRIYYLTLASQLMNLPIKTPTHFLENLIKTIDSQSQIEIEIRQSFILDAKLSQAYYSPRNRRYNSEFAIMIAKSNNKILKFYFDDKWLGILKKPIPNPDDNQLLFDTWWKSDGKSWTEQFNYFFTQQPKIIPNFGLTSRQLDRLKQYFISNEFLLECMNTDCVISINVRQEITNNLFIPIGEIDVLIG
jgi:energy-coupling factor transporter ATP-binding protein EcfA2